MLAAVLNISNFFKNELLNKQNNFVGYFVYRLVTIKNSFNFMSEIFYEVALFNL